MELDLVYLGSCVQLYLLAETPKAPPPAFGLIYEGAIGQPRKTFLFNPLFPSILCGAIEEVALNKYRNLD